MAPRANLSQIAVPQDFKIFPRSGGQHLPREGFFYNTILALKDVALGNYNTIMPIQRFTSERFPEPVIQFYGNGAGLPRRYLVWGLLMSIWNIIFTSDFRTLLVTLYYRSAEVGGILFGPQESGTGPLRLPTAKEEEDTTVPPPSNGTPNDYPFHPAKNIPSNPLPSNRVTTEISPFGAAMPARNVYMALISALSEAAVHGATDRLEETFTSHFDGFPCSLVTRPVMPPRRIPPVYQWGHLIVALPQVMEEFVGRAEFRESSLSIKVDGVTVGLARFEVGERGEEGVREG
ncbi:MAG: hypothetical protein LQ339_000563 [Xanthoria mediterranea]|nr:MAG: hypothetical protein LQ339_000563 [Xanthoria mediterranea]